MEKVFSVWSGREWKRWMVRVVMTMAQVSLGEWNEKSVKKND